MNTMELRAEYARRTGDDKNAFAMRQDGPEGFLYSDATIARALDEFSRLYGDPYTADANQAVAAQLFEGMGPRVGASLSQSASMIPTPQKSAMRSRGLFDDAMELARQEDYGQSAKFGARAVGEALLGDQRSRIGGMTGIMSGLLDYFRNRK
ncbi:hypothetical protein [Planktomarina sp.]|uniref:hypothetical protein n=1 Tax=Planktomarina sp. TaxID=2024851 RepID=UPI003C783A42